MSCEFLNLLIAKGSYFCCVECLCKYEQVSVVILFPFSTEYFLSLNYQSRVFYWVFCDYAIFKLVTNPKVMDQRKFKRYYLWYHFHEECLKIFISYYFLYFSIFALVKVYLSLLSFSNFIDSGLLVNSIFWKKITTTYVIISPFYWKSLKVLSLNVLKLCVVQYVFGT